MNERDKSKKRKIDSDNLDYKDDKPMTINSSFISNMF